MTYLQVSSIVPDLSSASVVFSSESTQLYRHFIYEATKAMKNDRKYVKAFPTD